MPYINHRDDGRPGLALNERFKTSETLAISVPEA
jgi:hypothetical protein